MKALKAFGFALAISNAILTVLVLWFWSLDGFLVEVVGLYGTRLAMWFDVLCNASYFIVFLTVALWIVFWREK